MQLAIWIFASVAAFYGIVATYVIAQAITGWALGVRVERIAIGISFAGRWGGIWKIGAVEWEFGAWPLTGLTKFANRPETENDCPAPVKMTGYYEDLNLQGRIAILLSGPLTSLGLGLALLCAPISLSSRQLLFVGPDAGTIHPVAFSGLTLSDDSTTLKGQRELVVDLAQFVAPRYAYLKTLRHCGGYVGALASSGAVGTHSFGGWLTWIGLISVVNGFVNLLPIPVLNGGHILICVWQAICGAPMSQKWLMRWTTAVAPIMILLLARIAFADFLWVMDLIFG